MRPIRIAILMGTSAALLHACSRPVAPANSAPKSDSGESQGSKSGFTESTGGDSGRDATGASSNPSDPYGKKPDTSQNPARSQAPAKTPANKSTQ